MEMGFSQADAARRLNVSRSVVQRLWDQYQSEDSVSRRPVPADHELQHLQKTVSSSFGTKEKNHYSPPLVADHFQASGRRISATTVRNRLHNAGLYARRPVVCAFPSTDDSEGTAYAGQEHVFWTQQQWASVLFTDESRFTMESDSGVY
ncbi:transposable element Tcb2 transposase [Trichonephila clavipes]|nr:transposable element Tcb2 transposase [Trichonephila clavipes]